MCNVWNHPPGCRCGWGGEGHKGRRKSGNPAGAPSWGGGYTKPSGGVWRSPSPTSSGTSSPSSRELVFRSVPNAEVLGGDQHYRRYESYVNPNACCPVCSQQVFFYQSPNGGRVFFDSLGPPWPKHPCTDNYQPHSSGYDRHSSRSMPPAIVGSHSNHYNWRPFLLQDVHFLQCSNGTPEGLPVGIVRLEGHIYINDRRSEFLVLYLSARDFRNRESLLFVHLLNEPYWLASIVVDAQGDIHPTKERVYMSLQELVQRKGRKEFANIGLRTSGTTVICGYCQRMTTRPFIENNLCPFCRKPIDGSPPVVKNHAAQVTDRVESRSREKHSPARLSPNSAQAGVGREVDIKLKTCVHCHRIVNCLFIEQGQWPLCRKLIDGVQLATSTNHGEKNTFCFTSEVSSLVSSSDLKKILDDSVFLPCEHCGSHVNITCIMDKTCPVCQAPMGAAAALHRDIIERLANALTKICKLRS